MRIAIIVRTPSKIIEKWNKQLTEKGVIVVWDQAMTILRQWNAVPNITLTSSSILLITSCQHLICVSRSLIALSITPHQSAGV